jgi:ATP:guanido phosphotransferase, C-terminal catalytic domain
MLFFLLRVGRNIDGFGLSPGITKDQRLGVENLMKKAFANLTGDLAGTYYPLTGMEEKVRQQLVDDHFLFMSGDANLKVAKRCALLLTLPGLPVPECGLR